MNCIIGVCNISCACAVHKLIKHYGIKYESRYDEEFGLQKEKSSFNCLKCSNCRYGFTKFVKSKITKYALNFLPILRWLPNYHWRKNILDDTIAGITLGVITIPQGMAYGMLASLRPVYGLYTSLFAPVFYALFGTSHHISVGTFAVISLLVSAAIAPYHLPWQSADSDIEQETVVNASMLINTSLDVFDLTAAIDDSALVEASSSLSLLVGLFMTSFGLLKLGFVSAYLSDQLAAGFTTGAACHVFTSQVGKLLGLSNLPSSGQPLGLIKVYWQICSRLHETNHAAVITSIICIFLLTVNKEFFSNWFKQYLKFPFPMELIVVVFSTLTSHFMKLNINYKVSIVGKIPNGVPHPSIPEISLFSGLWVNALVISVITYTLSISISKVLASKHGYRIDADQEWLAYGLTHVFSSFFQCHCCGSSLSRSLVMDNQGGKTQLASFISCIVIFVVLMFMTELFHDLPKCVLAAVIIVALKGMFDQFKQVPKLWRQSRVDCMIWIMSFLGVVILDVRYGLVVAVLFALLTVVIRSQWPEGRTLGNLPGTDFYSTLELYDAAQEVPGVKIFRFEAPLYFANVDVFYNKIWRCLELNAHRNAKPEVIDNQNNGFLMNERSNSQTLIKTPVHHLIIDCSSMPYIDKSGVKMLKLVNKDLAQRGISVLLCRCRASVRRTLTACNFEKHVPKTSWYASVHDAVSKVTNLQPSTTELQESQ